jgi:hypothetical protein
MELDAKLGIEREANRVRFRVTHWAVAPYQRGAAESRMSCGCYAIMG